MGLGATHLMSSILIILGYDFAALPLMILISLYTLFAHNPAPELTHESRVREGGLALENIAMFGMLICLFCMRDD